jgi:transposase
LFPKEEPDLDAETQGFRACLRVVAELAGRRRRADKNNSALGHTPAARTIVRLITTGRDYLTMAETVMVTATESDVAHLAEMRDLVADFQDMFRRRAAGELDEWLGLAQNSLVTAFANGVLKDKVAVIADIASEWSNGQNKIYKPRLVKRQMCR